MYDPICDLLFDGEYADRQLKHLFQELDPPCGHRSYCGVLFCEYEITPPPQSIPEYDLDWKPCAYSRMTLCRSYTNDQAREVLLKKVRGGLTNRRIADEVGISTYTVKRILHAARIGPPWRSGNMATVTDIRLALLNWLLDGPPRRWLEGERQKLDPWGTWMHSTFLAEAAQFPERWAGRTEDEEDRTHLEGRDGANLICSRVADGPLKEDLHIVALDIDLPMRVVPSTNPGKGHLYINKPLPWWKIEKLLDVLVEVGIIHRNYRKHTVARGYTCLRPAYVSKPPAVHKHWGSDFDVDKRV